MNKRVMWAAAALIAVGIPAAVSAQTAGEKPSVVAAPRAAAVNVPKLPSDFVIGAEDVIGVLFWRDQDMSGDVTVRPDGMITLPLVGDIRAAGLRTDQLKAEVEQAAGKFITEPNVTILVRQINSRKVYITGEVSKPGAYPMTADRSVMQIIAMAGGLTEYADSNNIMILRTENGKQRSYKFHYKDVLRGKALPQNIQLQPGDTVVVP
jgi:polysaccharide export outer membrane protein